MKMTECSLGLARYKVQRTLDEGTETPSFRLFAHFLVMLMYAHLSDGKHLRTAIIAVPLELMMM